MALRLRAEGDRLVAVEVPYAYCPACQRNVEVPEEARSGDALTCCGRIYRLTCEFGAWALEQPDDHDVRNLTHGLGDPPKR